MNEDQTERDGLAPEGDSMLRAMHGDRETLERRLMWAILFDHPDKEVLTRRLTPAANSTLYVNDSSE